MEPGSQFDERVRQHIGHPVRSDRFGKGEVKELVVEPAGIKCHGSVTDQFLHLGNRNQLSCQGETPTGIGDKRFDAEFSTPLGEPDLAADITVVHPLGASVRRNTARNQGPVALEAAERRKHEKYAEDMDLPQWRNHKFYPAAVSVFGGLGPSAQALLRALANTTPEQGVDQYIPVNYMAPTLMVYYQQRIAVAVAEGNANRLAPFLAGAPHDYRQDRGGRFQPA